MVYGNNEDLQQVLNKKISYTSYGKSIQQQLEKLSDQHSFRITFSQETKDIIKLDSKKFHYPHTRISHILRRLCRDAGLDYKTEGSEVMITIMRNDISNSIANKNR